MGRGKPANHPVTGSRGDGDRRDACGRPLSAGFNGMDSVKRRSQTVATIYLRNELAKSDASTVTTFFCTFDVAMSWFNLVSHAAPSIGNSTVSFKSDEYTIAFASSTE